MKHWHWRSPGTWGQVNKGEERMREVLKPSRKVGKSLKTVADKWPESNTEVILWFLRKSLLYFNSNFKKKKKEPHFE